MAHRYCTTCGNELPEDARFCGGCGSPAHQTAAVATPEADVDVPPLPNSQEASLAAAPTGRVSEAESKRNAFIALGGVVWVIVLIGTLAAGSGNGTVLVFLVGIVLFVVATRTSGEWSPRAIGSAGKDERGRLVLRSGSPSLVAQTERARLLEGEISEYMRDGFFVRHRTDTTAQLVKPKKFSFVWALLWLLVFGVGIVVYLIYYAAKRDEGRYVEVDEYGTVKATRQVHHVL